MDYPLPLNKYQIRSSHNTFGNKYFWDNASNIKYIHEFLNAGFRGLEIDVYYDKKKRIRVGHHGLNLSFSRSNFKEYLLQIQEWRLANTNHLPIFVQLEVNNPKKNDGLVTDVFSIVTSVFPKELLVGPKKISKYRKENPGLYWPSADSLRSRLIFNIQKTAMKIYLQKLVKGVENFSSLFFVTQDNEFFADYSYLEVGDDTQIAKDKMELMKDDIKLGKIVRVSPSYRFSFWRKRIMNVKDCMNWGVNLIAVDKKNEGKNIHYNPYMEM